MECDFHGICSALDGEGHFVNLVEKVSLLLVGDDIGQLVEDNA